jgi:hypothetical protein
MELKDLPQIAILFMIIAIIVYIGASVLTNFSDSFYEIQTELMNRSGTGSSFRA